jgi:hypothetical protein
MSDQPLPQLPRESEMAVSYPREDARPRIATCDQLRADSRAFLVRQSELTLARRYPEGIDFRQDSCPLRRAGPRLTHAR